MLSGGLFRDCLISCPVLMAPHLKHHRLEGDGVLKTAELTVREVMTKAGVPLELPLFLCLHSLEQTSPNKLHDMWILRMQRGSVSRTIKELQPRLQYRRRLLCLISLRHRWFGFPNKQWLSEAWETEPGVRVSFLQH